MAEPSDRIDRVSCSSDCNQSYLACISRGEHDSVCRMQRAQCGCRCTAD